MNIHSTKISTRINLLAAMTLLVAGLLSAVYFYGDRVVSQDIQIQSDFARMAQLAQKMEIGALQMRRSEKDFLLRKKLKYLQEYERAEKAVDHSLEEAEKLSISGPVRANITRLEKGILQHNKIFHKVVGSYKQIGLDEKLGLQGELRKAVHGLEAMIEAESEKDLMAKVLMMRRHEKDFIMRGKAKYVALMIKRRIEFDELLAGTFFSKEKKAKFSALMDAYHNGFKAYANASMNTRPNIKKLSAIFAGMQPDIKAVLVSSRQGLENIGASFAESRIFTRNLFLGAAILSLLLALSFGALIGRSITTPLRKMVTVMQKLADGDVSVEIPGRQDKSEIGAMAKTVEVFQKNAVQKLSDEEQKAREQQAASEKRKVMEAATADFTTKIGAIVEALTAVSSEQDLTANSMASISEKTSTEANSVSVASEQALANVQAVASATEEMTSTIGEIAHQVEQASSASRQAVEEVESTSAQMTALTENASKIGEVVELISSIAEQTNLLALNATIESARAGDAGKGFAVVAGEVKQLASQTAKATEEISQQVGEVQAASKRASGSMGNVADVIRRVDEMSTAIAAAMEEQGAATQEIAGNVNQAATGTQQVNDSILTVADASREAGVVSDQVQSIVDELSSQVGELRNEVDIFVEKIKAA